MFKKGSILFFVMVVILLIASPIVVLGATHEKDVKGAQDHPLLSRFPGSVIRYYETKESDEYILPTGENIGEWNEEGERLDSKVVVGDITRITYEAPESTSTLKIYKNYKSDESS